MDKTTNLGVMSSNLFGRASKFNGLVHAFKMTWLIFGSGRDRYRGAGDYGKVELACIVVAFGAGGAEGVEFAASTITVRVEVEVRPLVSEATYSIGRGR